MEKCFFLERHPLYLLQCPSLTAFFSWFTCLMSRNFWRIFCIFCLFQCLQIWDKTKNVHTFTDSVDHKLLYLLLFCGHFLFFLTLSLFIPMFSLLFVDFNCPNTCCFVPKSPHFPLKLSVNLVSRFAAVSSLANHKRFWYLNMKNE